MNILALLFASFLFLGCEFRLRFESNGPSSVIKVVNGNYRGSEVTVRHLYLADGIVEENSNIDLVENISMEDVIEVAYDSRRGHSYFEVPVAFSARVDGDTYDDIHCSFAASFLGGSLDMWLSDCLHSDLVFVDEISAYLNNRLVAEATIVEETGDGISVRSQQDDSISPALPPVLPSVLPPGWVDRPRQ